MKSSTGDINPMSLLILAMLKLILHRDLIIISASIGLNLSKKISQHQGVTFKQFLSDSYTNSFFMKPKVINELLKIISDLRSSYTTGVDGICSTIMKYYCRATGSLYQPLFKYWHCNQNDKNCQDNSNF